MVKNLPASAGDARDAGLIPGSGRSPGEGHGNPLQYSCLENAMGRGAWWATVQGLKESDTSDKRPQIAKTILRKKNRAGGTSLPDLRPYKNLGRQREYGTGTKTET